MSSRVIVALGQDEHWLNVMLQSADETVTVRIIHCVTDLPKCLESLTEVESDAIVFVDATGQSDVAGLARRVREQGFLYVIVVAADPSWREAQAVFREAGAYDYLKKSYVLRDVRMDIERCLAAKGKEMGKHNAMEQPDI